MVHRANDFCPCFFGSLMILFMRDNCGPIETINQTVFLPQNLLRTNIQFLGSAHQRMEDVSIGDRSYRPPRRALNVRGPLR